MSVNVKIREKLLKENQSKAPGEDLTLIHADVVNKKCIERRSALGSFKMKPLQMSLLQP